MINAATAIPIVAGILGHDEFSLSSEGDLEMPDAKPGEVVNVGDLEGFPEAYASAEAERAAFDLVKAIRVEVARRIIAEASAATRENMNAAMTAGVLSESEQVAFVDAFQWVEAVRAKGKELAASMDASFEEDHHWPSPSEGARALAARF